MKSSRWLKLVRYWTHGVHWDGAACDTKFNSSFSSSSFCRFIIIVPPRKGVLGKGNYDPTIHQCMCIWHFLFKHLQWWPKGFASLTLHTSDLQFPSPLPMGSRAQGKYNQEPPRARCGTRRLSQLECQDGLPIRSMIHHIQRHQFYQGDGGPKMRVQVIGAQFTILKVNIKRSSPR